MEYAFSIFDIEQFDFCSYEVDVTWDNVQSVDVGGVDGVANVGVVDDAFVERAFYFFEVDAQSA